MKPVWEFLSLLRKQGIKIRAEGDRLQWQAPKGALTPQLRSQLAARKGEILAYLTEIRRPSFSMAPIPSVAREGPLPLSFSQQRLWFLDRLEEGESAAYNIPGAMTLLGALNRSALEQAFSEVVRRHEVLRTVFCEGEEGPVQVILPELKVALPVIDLTDFPEHERRAQLTRRLTEAAHEPFDLTTGPLLRAALYRLCEEEHSLFFNMHHIVSDGWSFGVFFRELGLLYAAFIENRPSPLPKLPIQYVDYAAWQRDWLRGEALQRQLDYWREQLAGAPAVLELPTDHPRPPVQRHRGGYVHFTITEETTSGLKKVDRRAGATPFMTLYAAFAVLLSRYSGQEEVVIGSPIAGRRHSALEPLIGFFVNMLALRANLTGDPGFLELLARVKSMTLEAYAHQDLPFEQLVEELEPERSLSNTPLFQVMLVLQNAPLESVELAGLEMAPAELGYETAKFDLTLLLQEGDERLQGVLEYNADLFDESTIHRMAGHFRTLLRGIIADPDRRISDLPLLAEAERQQILVEWHGTRTDYPRDRCIHQLFEEQAEATPDAVAVVFGEERLTYRELNERANRLAHHLRKLGIGPEVLVGICVERSLEMIVGLLGILKAGGAYVPLDPEYPQERLTFMIEDGALDVLLIHRASAGKLAGAAPQRVLLEADQPSIAGQPVDNPESGATPESPAYVIYTSGSTGHPKGVVIPHRALANFLLAMRHQPGLTASDALLAVTTVCFDIAGLELYLPLIVGARVVIATREVATSGALLMERLQSSGITVMQATPATWRLLLEAGWRGDGRLKLLCGGEALDRLLAESLLERCGSLWNLYGPTETTIWSTLHRIEDVAGPIPIGRPIRNTQVYVLDGQLQPVPLGVTGELYIGGLGLALGYLHRPELTAERFVIDPFAEEACARMYRTGDLARWRPDGCLEWLGRVDHQVKIRGYRIELGEIEARLAAHPGIKNAAVIVREDHPGERRLVAYLTPTEPTAPQTEEEERLVADLRAQLQATLPHYMTPAAFVLLERLPLTPNGKLDVKALQAPEPISRQRGYVAPETEIERQLCEIWQTVLRLERVGATDHFFSIGGDSILSLTIVGHAISKGLPVRVRDMFQAPTVRELAHLLVDRERVDKRPVSEPFSLVTEEERARFGDGIEDAYPLAALQAGMVFHSQLDETGALYHDVFSFHLKAPWDRTSFEQALERVIAEHATLRTRFSLDGERPLQFVRTQVVAPFFCEDLRRWSQEEQERWLNAWMEEERHNDFRWGEEPLFRIFVHRRTEESFEYALSCHHALLDGWSMATFNAQLLMTYRRLLSGEELPHIASPPPYREFVASEKAAVGSEENKAYWLETLKEAPATLLPRGLAGERTDRKSGAVRAWHNREMDALAPRLAALARRLGTPLQHVLLAAHMKVLSRLSGQQEVVSCVVFNGRPEQAGGERTLGLFLNSLPLRVKLENGSWRDLIEQVSQSATAIWQHRLYPLAAIQQETGLQFSEVLFNYIHFHAYGALEGKEDFEFLQQRFFAETNFPLTVNFSKALRGDGLELNFSYDPTLISEEFAERISGYYANALTAMVENCEALHEEFSLLGESELYRLLIEWNDTATDYPKDRCIHSLFEEQAGKTPDAAAVVFGERRLSYRELNERANQLARHLHSLGVGPETLVGICVERSLEMIVGLLGILKAGGAYVPLDPEYPPERLAFMVEDARAAVVLVHDQTRGRLPASTARVVCLDRDRPAIAQEPSEGLSIETTPKDLAYVMYTSGSTGTPKGVAVVHRNVVRLVKETDYAHLDSGEVLLQFAPLAFDASTFEIWGALLNGGRLAIAPPGRLSLEELGETLRRCEVTTLWLTASLFHLMVERRAEDLANLRQLLAGGEVLFPQHIDIALKHLRGGRLINGYGPTENTTFTCCFAFPTAGWPADRPSPIGRPIANTRVYILDAQRQPAPIGVAGELHAGGDGLARGYLNRPELTIEKFISDPFSDAPESRLYKTGDLCRWLPDGAIEFLGRVDHQVKIRGFRIELGEIEAALVKHPTVQESVVVVRESTDGDKQLVAYSATKELETGEAELRETLKAHLKQSLPEYMVPSLFVFLESFPRTPSGKIDRQALPEPGSAESQTDYAVPLDEVEMRLIQIWEELLEVRPIGRRDDFFDRGGHSLLALRLMGNIRETFDVDLPLTALFEAPTVAALADLLRRDAMPPAFSILVGIQPRGARPPLFCVHPGGGTAFCYASLTGYLGEEQPIYGLQAVASHGEQAPLTRVEEMAARYIAEMRTVQSRGPYRLCGWSFGGIIAFEMGRQLYEQGEGVAPLFLIDSCAPAFFSDEPLDEVEFIQTMAAVWRASIPETILDELRRLDPPQRPHRFVEAAREMRAWPLGFDPARIERLWEVYRANMLAGSRYDPSPWPATIRLLCAEPGQAREMPPTLGWDTLAATVDTRSVPGKHEVLLDEPCVRHVAEHLSAWIKEVESGLLPKNCSI